MLFTTLLFEASYWLHWQNHDSLYRSMHQVLKNFFLSLYTEDAALARGSACGGREGGCGPRIQQYTGVGDGAQLHKLLEPHVSYHPHFTELASKLKSSSPHHPSLTALGFWQ